MQTEGAEGGTEHSVGVRVRVPGLFREPSGRLSPRADHL